MIPNNEEETTKIEKLQQNKNDATICTHSYWIYTDIGGILTVLPDINTWVRKGQKIAVVTSIFGVLKKEYFSPEDGIIIGKATNPINQSGDRILHLGVVTDTFKNGKAGLLFNQKDLDDEEIETTGIDEGVLMEEEKLVGHQMRPFSSSLSVADANIRRVMVVETGNHYPSGGIRDGAVNEIEKGKEDELE